MTAFRSYRAAQLLASTSQNSQTNDLFAQGLRVWKIGMGLTFLFNCAVAVFLNLTRLTPGDLYTNFVYSQCIGLLICAGILIPHSLLSRARRHRRLAVIFLSFLGMITGLIAGRALAAWICGQPLDWRTGVLEESSTFAVSLVISIFATALSIAYFWSREREAVLSLSAAQASNKAEIVSHELTETQLRLLRAQIEPHMLFNTLSNLRALIAQDPPAAQKMLDRLIDFFRASLDASRSEWTSLQREFDLASDYLNLIRVRLGSRLQFELDLPAGLANIPIPSMLIQPLVENAVKHGIEPALDGGKIRVQAREIDDLLEIRVEDDGVGPSSADDTQNDETLVSNRPANQKPASDKPGPVGSGFGNQHVRERLFNLYGEQARFELSSTSPHGTLVRILIPAGARSASPRL